MSTSWRDKDDTPSMAELLANLHTATANVKDAADKAKADIRNVPLPDGVYRIADVLIDWLTERTASVTRTISGMVEDADPKGDREW